MLRRSRSDAFDRRSAEVAGGDGHAAVAERFPDARWGTPEGVADLVEFLASDRGAWIRGQVINSEGGWDRFR
ncbi:MAG: SDR family oxidoreductase [Ilumatobacteraceae bacterium]